MSKHMTLNDRQKIHACLLAGCSFADIAKQIGKNPTTVSREVKHHRIVWIKNPYGRSSNRCVNRNNCNLKGICRSDCNRKCAACGRCTKICNMYVEEYCQKLTQPPYVCAACPDVNRCPLEKFQYDPFYAQNEYRETLVESREGFNLTDAEIGSIDEHITPLIRQGQSINNAILTCNDAILVSRRTVYRLVDRSALAARNIDLPRKCKIKPRKGDRRPRKIEKHCREGRTYQDFETYMRENPEVICAQMDSVVGCSGSRKVLLTLCLKGNYMIAFLRADNTAKSALECIEFLYEGLGYEDFIAFFPVILTDNGSEFSNPTAIETAPDGRTRTRVFYCDPMASWQKPNVERNHELFRRILPTGSSFDDLTQDDVCVIASHVNSYARLSLGNKTPMDTLAFYYGEERAEKLLRLLRHKRIQPQDIVLTPALIRR